MTAKKESFTTEDYKNATEFNLTLDQVAAADEEIEALERLQTKGFNTDSFVDTSWADEVIARTQPHVLPQSEGPPVSHVPARPYGYDGCDQERPWRKQKTEAKAPPQREAFEETRAHDTMKEMQQTEPKAPPQREAFGESPAKDTMWAMQRSEPDAPPTGEVRLFRYCVPHILKGAIIMCSG